jgi:Holliday junction resolvasome RuvABC endonuclease subunit
MKVLAFDQASRTSGYSVFEDGKLITYGKFTYDDDDFGVRLMHIRNKVISLIDTHNPDKIAFEDIQLQNNVVNNVDTFKKLAEVFGIIYELVTERNISHDIVLASSWKSLLSIKGRERAEQKKNA